MKNKLLSIVIPTKDRQYYCYEVIKHILSLRLPNTQIVIQDNSSNDNLKKLLSQDLIRDKITYHYNPELLSFVDNFSQAIELCSGEYICMIGDDDSVLPNIVDIAKYAKDNNIDAIIPELLVYFWPSQNPIKDKYRNGFLTYKNFSGNSYTCVDPLSSLKKLIKNNFQDYQYLGVPRIYHGLVRRSAIDKVKERVGTYFNGLTPDMFMSVCLCFTCNNIKSFSMPITISGICPSSGSSASATGKHTGNLKDAPHFKGHQNYEWYKDVPYIYTVETIWAESGLQAIKMMKEDLFLTYYNPASFILELYAKYPQFKDVLFREGENLGLALSDFESAKFKRYLNTHIYKYMRKFIKVLEGYRIHNIENVNSISQACELITRNIKLNKIYVNI